MESKKPDALGQDLEVTATGKSKRKGRRDSYHKKLRKQNSRALRPGRVKRLQRIITNKAAKIENLQMKNATLTKSINKSVAERKSIERYI